MAMKSIIRLLTATLLLVVLGSAQATPVSFTLTGAVTYDDTGDGSNIFGLPVGGAVTATGSFDDSLIGGDIISGNGTIAVSTITDLVITVGSEIFTDLDDNGSGLLTIVNGTVIDGNGPAGFVYAGTNPQLFTSDATETFIGTQSDYSTNIFGTWNTFNLTPVPVPAAVWLFGSGLLGLAGVARRKRNRI